MSDLRIMSNQGSVNRTQDTNWVAVRGLRDGSISQIPWLQALCLEGRMFGMQCGDATLDPVGPGTFGAGAVDLDEFDYLQTVPATVAVIPVYFAVGFVGVGTAAECGIHLLWGSTGVISNGTATNTIFNMRPGSSNSSACTVATLGDDGGTAFVPAGVIYENVTTAITGAANTPQQFVPPYSAATAPYIAVIEGLASPNRQIAGFTNGQAATGYLTSVWAELPIADIE